QVGDAVGERRDHPVLALHHRRHVEAELAHPDTVGGEVLARIAVALRRIEQGLGRDATHVEAGPAQAHLAGLGAALLDDGHLHAQLRRPDRTDIPAGPGSDDDEVVGHEDALEGNRRRGEGEEGRGSGPRCWPSYVRMYPRMAESSDALFEE